MGKSRYFFALSGIILMLGAIGLAANQLNFGIDFESGSRLTASLARAREHRRRCATRSRRSTSKTPRSRT